jgi:hypothetical protein
MNKHNDYSQLRRPQNGTAGPFAVGGPVGGSIVDTPPRPHGRSVLTIDPGADAGWAWFDNGTLAGCGLGAPAQPNADRVIIERPMIYPGGRQKARPADVIKLATRAGEAGGLYARSRGVEPEYVEPHAWKGSVDKNIHHARIWAKLSTDEQAIVSTAARGVAPSKRHNILDAIGIGLWAIGRRA